MLGVSVQGDTVGIPAAAALAMSGTAGAGARAKTINRSGLRWIAVPISWSC